MKTAACLLALWSISSSALADAPTAYIGPPDCRMLNQYPREHERVTWSGPCKDGYAHGNGVQVWYQDDIATTSYEGPLVRGRREGFGTAVGSDRDVYVGDFRDGMPEGKGTQVFALGGRYEGGFKAGLPDGKGVLTYAGSGRRQEVQFEEGKLSGAPAVPMDDTTYIQRKQESGIDSRLPRAQVYASFPTNKSWARLTRAQQEVIRAPYKALAPDDEPPYPLRGPARMFAALAEAAGKLHADDGELRLLVLVGADGKASSVSVLGKPDPDLMRFAAAALMLEKYKSAICDGNPCEMIYRFTFSLVREL